MRLSFVWYLIDLWSSILWIQQFADKGPYRNFTFESTADKDPLDTMCAEVKHLSYDQLDDEITKAIATGRFAGHDTHKHTHQLLTHYTSLNTNLTIS